MLFPPPCHVAGTAAAQTITVRVFPDDAPRAYMSHLRENALSLDGRQTRLAPGGQIRGQNNLIVQPAAVPKFPRQVSAGQVRRALSRLDSHRRGSRAAGQVPASERPGPSDRAGAAAIRSAAPAALRRAARAACRPAASRHHELKARPPRADDAARLHPHLRLPDERVRLGQDRRRARRRRGLTSAASGPRTPTSSCSTPARCARRRRRRCSPTSAG